MGFNRTTQNPYEPNASSSILIGPIASCFNVDAMDERRIVKPENYSAAVSFRTLLPIFVLLGIQGVGE
jgi:hypothetical protein